MAVDDIDVQNFGFHTIKLDFHSPSFKMNERFFCQYGLELIYFDYLFKHCD